MRIAILLAIGGLSMTVLAGFALNTGSGSHSQSATTVEVGDSWFCDPGDTTCQTTDGGDVDVMTTVNAGDQIDWSWVGSLPHTTTACSGSDFATCDGSQGWDSGAQMSGTFSFTFKTAGTFYYRCNIHPDQMRGQITVLATQEPTPSPTPPPAPSPTPSPSSSAATPTPVAVPAGGGAPPETDGSARVWWLIVATGGMLLGSASIFTLRGLRR